MLLRRGKWLEKCFQLTEKPYDKGGNSLRTEKWELDENFMERCIKVYIGLKLTTSVNKYMLNSDLLYFEATQRLKY